MYKDVTDEELKKMIERVKKELDIIQKLKIKSLEKMIDLYLEDLSKLLKETEKRKK